MSNDREVTLAIGFLTILFFYTLWAIRKKDNNSSDSDIYKAFDMNSSYYSIYSTDLGGRKNSCRLSFSGVTGDCDAVFKHYKENLFVAGEYKGRALKGKIRLYEYYQVMLYMGLLRSRFKCEVVGVLGFTNMSKKISFDESCFNALIDNKNNAAKAKRKGKVSFFVKPLHKTSKFILPNYVQV